MHDCILGIAAVFDVRSTNGESGIESRKQECLQESAVLLEIRYVLKIPERWIIFHEFKSEFKKTMQKKNEHMRSGKCSGF